MLQCWWLWLRHFMSDAVENLNHQAITGLASEFETAAAGIIIRRGVCRVWNTAFSIGHVLRETSKVTTRLVNFELALFKTAGDQPGEIKRMDHQLTRQRAIYEDTSKTRQLNH